MSEILSGPVDITDRVRALGWQTTGLTVRAHTERDEDETPYAFDCYTSADIEAWKNDDWCFVGVIVTVTDAYGFEWAEASLWGTEAGTWIDTDDNGNVTGERELNPLTDQDHPLPDLIGEAMSEAMDKLARFTLPTIIAPPVRAS